LVLVLLAGLGQSLGGCAGRSRTEDRRQDQIQETEGWTKLGERTVHWRRGRRIDSDAIEVGADEGRFARVMLRAEHSDLELLDVRIVFGDDTSFSPRIRHLFREGERSRTIDLPGGARVIRRVSFRYRNLPEGGRAQLELWAK
jgi:hypothetical protein